MQVKKVVIGILDPNQGVCGKGLLQLQQSKIEVELFPNNLAQRIKRLNDRFIQEQQRFGMQITFPENHSEFRGKTCRVKGTFTNQPNENVLAITYVGGHWWPQLSPIRVIPEKGNEWEVDIDFGIACPVKIYIVKANELGMQIVNYFRKLVFERQQVIGRVAEHFGADREEVRRIVSPLFWSFEMPSLPKGLDMEDCIELNVTSLDSLE